MSAFVKVQGGVIEKYPYTAVDLRKDNPETIFPVNPGQATFESFGAMSVVVTPMPEHNPLTEEVIETAPVLAEGIWSQAWTVVAKDTDSIMAPFIVALEERYDAEAKKGRRYDNRYTCALRAGYAGPYQQEGASFGLWMDTCNAYAYEQMALVQAGQRPMPTPDELVGELPPMVWP